MHEDLRAAVAADMPRLKRLLADLVRLPSVSASGYDQADTRATAATLIDTLQTSGYSNCRLLEAGRGNPAVFGEIPAPDGAPTVLLYAHYDVQPPGPEHEWETPPFEPIERDGRLYGRGSADDKSGIVTHLGAIAALGGRPPVGVQVFFEGEEEAGSANLEEILTRHADLLKPDVIVVGDGGNWAVGTPAFCTSLRGMAAITFQVRTLRSAVHSGQYGGVYPDALSVMARLLATLQDDRGVVTVPGLVSEETGGPEYPQELFDAQIGVIDGVAQIGEGSIASRLWTRPSVAVLALDAPPVAQAINQLVPAARAKVGLRLAPGQDSAEALAALEAHLMRSVPWGAELEVLHREAGDPIRLDAENTAVEAWSEGFLQAYGKEPVYMGSGGSIPFISTFSRLYPGAPILVVGAMDPTSAIHAPNESQDLGDLEKATLAEAIALRLLGGEVPST